MKSSKCIYISTENRAIIEDICKEKGMILAGMTFENSIKYKIDSQVLEINQNTKLVRENYMKVKQNVNIGIAGVKKHIGATTVAVNLTKYLSELPNIRACYIENNNNDSLISIIEDEESIYSKDTRKITYQGVEKKFSKPKTMPDILACDYNFYIYDYGALTEMSEEGKNSFMTRNLKILVAGNKIWEIPNLINALQVIGEEPTTYLLFNFVSNEEKEESRKSLGNYWSKRCMFSELVLNPFQIKTRDFYAKVLKPYLLENEKEKKILIFCFWIIISILVTIGTTIMLNEALRLDLIEKVKKADEEIERLECQLQDEKSSDDGFKKISQFFK